MTMAASARFWIALGGILLVAVGLRFFDLDADPPVGISWSQGLYTDGPIVVHNARNAVLWGTPILDYGEDMYWYPLSHVTALLGFRFFGVSSATARGTAAALSVATIFCIAFALSLDARPRVALIAAGLLSISFPHAVYSRLPLAEPAMVLLMAFAFLAFVAAETTRRTGLMAVAGFLAMASPLFGKAHAAYFPAVGILALLTGEAAWRKRRVFAYSAGAVVCVVVWAAVLLLPHGKGIVDRVMHESVVKHQVSPSSSNFILESATNALVMGARSGFLSRDFITVLLGFLALPVLLVRRDSTGIGAGVGVRFAAFWLVLGWVSLACVKLPAPRYLLAVFPPLAVLAGALLSEMSSLTITGRSAGSARDAASAAGSNTKKVQSKRPDRRDENRATARAGGWRLIALIVVSCLACLVVACHFSALSVPLPSLGGVVGLFPSDRDDGYPWTLIPFAVLGAAVWTWMVCWRTSASVPRALPAALTVLAILLSIVQFARWVPARTHYLVSAGRGIGQLLADDAHLLGAYANAVCLDNGLHVSPYFGPEYTGPEHDPDLFAHYGISHVVLVAPGDHRTLQERYPEIYAGLLPVAAFPFESLYSNRILLCRVPSESGGRQIHHYRPTAEEEASVTKLRGQDE